MTSRPSVVLVDGNSVQRERWQPPRLRQSGDCSTSAAGAQVITGPGVIRANGIHGFERARRSESNQLATKSKGEKR
jgi:hypothetical protein